MVPAAIRQLDPAIHRQPVYPRRGEEQMEQARVVGIANVLHVELPVIRHRLRVGAEDHHVAPDDAVDIGAHLGAEILLKRRRRLRQGHEYQPAIDRHAERREAVGRQVEIGRHAALAAGALLEGDRGQTARKIVGPVVVDAGQPPIGPSGLVDADQIAAMDAAIDHRVDAAVRVADGEDRRVADPRAPVVAGFGDFLLQHDEMPDRPAEYPGLFRLVDIGVRIDPVGDPAHPLRGPFQHRVDRHLPLAVPARSRRALYRHAPGGAIRRGERLAWSGALCTLRRARPDGPETGVRAPFRRVGVRRRRRRQ